MYGYINRKKAETYLAKNIKNKFGKYVILIEAGYSDKLNEYLTIYNLDEFITSCLNCKTEERCENMYLRDKKALSKKFINS